MKRDMDLIRKIAFALEDGESFSLARKEVKLEGFSDQLVLYNLELMGDSGLVAFLEPHKVHNVTFRPEAVRLTWSGHDFLDAARDDTTWNAVTKHVKETATSVTFDSLKALLKYAGQQALARGSDWLLKVDWTQFQKWTI